jgi:hypothetical protein
VRGCDVLLGAGPDPPGRPGGAPGLCGSTWQGHPTVANVTKNTGRSCEMSTAIGRRYVAEEARRDRKPQRFGTRCRAVESRRADKGIIDATMRLSLVGFEMITVEVRVVVASISTFLDYAAGVGLPTGAAPPLLAAESEPVPTALLAAAARKAGAASRTALR